MVLDNYLLRLLVHLLVLTFQNVSDDSSPQLGGNLDVVTHSIVSTSNRNITLAPNGSGKVVVGANGIQFGDGSIQTLLVHRKGSQLRWVSHLVDINSNKGKIK